MVAMRVAAAASVLLGLGSQVSAEPLMLAGDTLRSAVAGKTVYVSTPVGSVPIVYRSNGTMTARSRILAGYSGPESDRGVWWVSNDRLCQRWQTWLDKEQHCYKMQKQGNTVYWSREDGRSGTATIAQ